jgi:hypothetical protein
MNYLINQSQEVAVATDYYWQDISTCPRGVKVQLLNPGGVAVYSHYSGPEKGVDIWLGWAPLPKRRPKGRRAEDLTTPESATDLGLLSTEEDSDLGQYLLGIIHTNLAWILLAIAVFGINRHFW